VTFGVFGRELDARVDEQLTDGRPRLPPGQRLVEGWPVLHYGGIPRVDLDSWELRVFGLVGEELRFDWEQVQALPQVKLRTDIHCVTTWSRYDNDWEGISFQHIMELAQPTPAAKHVVFHCYGGYTTNVPLEELDREDVLLVHSHDGAPLSEEHGAPLRGMIPQLYFWKSAKWIAGIEFVAEDRPGFWEMYGYHMHGDPWREERYG
jgi:DMSO/TMAO reductase YedYZ molybdopterin-dependent catalytic subunit